MIVEYVSEEEQDKILDMMIEASTEKERDELLARLPLQPGLAKLLKKQVGLEALLQSNLNLYDAVEKYGEGFLKE